MCTTVDLRIEASFFEKMLMKNKQKLLANMHKQLLKHTHTCLASLGGFTLTILYFGNPMTVIPLPKYKAISILNLKEQI